MTFITTDHDKCRKCYACVRACPVKTIATNQGLLQIKEQGCLDCGMCVLACSIQSKVIHNSIAEVQKWLVDRREVTALVAPSFVSSFEQAQKLPGMLKKIGFSHVVEVAYGAELCAQEYVKLLKEKSFGPVISSACSAVINLVEKYYPSLVKNLAPIDSPMVITAKIAKEVFPDCKTVFIGPCISKKTEAVDINTHGNVDAVITFRQLADWLEQEAIVPEGVAGIAWDNPAPKRARNFPLGGGLLYTAGMEENLTNMNIVKAEGSGSCIEILEAVARGQYTPLFLDLLFCKGCVSGPGMIKRNSYFVLANEVAKSTRLNKFKNTNQYKELFDRVNPDFRRCFTAKPIIRRAYTEKDIWLVLKETGKLGPQDLINCGACGYDTCWDKAIACYEGLAEKEMCLPYLLGQVPLLTKKMLEISQQLKLSIESINFSMLTVTQAAGKIAKNETLLNQFLSQTYTMVENTRQIADFCQKLSRSKQNGFGDVIQGNLRDMVQESKTNAQNTINSLKQISEVLKTMRDDNNLVLEQEKAIKDVTLSLEQVATTYEQLLTVGAALQHIGRNYS